MTTAPSHEVLQTWTTREAELISACSHLDRNVALPPLAQSVHVGSGDAGVKEAVGKEGSKKPCEWCLDR